MASKQEIRYITYSIFFAAIFFIFFLPWFMGKFDGQNPYLEFAIFNIGLIIFFQLFLKSMILKTSVRLNTAIGLTLLFIAIDILQPPYAVLTDGTLISSGPTLMKSSSDYMAGLIGSSFGLTGIWVYIFTYVATPAIILYIAAKILPNFVKNL